MSGRPEFIAGFMGTPPNESTYDVIVDGETVV